MSIVTYVDCCEMYHEALAALFRRGGMIQTRDPNILIIGVGQLKYLAERGLVPRDERGRFVDRGVLSSADGLD